MRVRLHFRRLTIRAALVVGFAVILGLWFASGYDFTRRLEEIEHRSAAINARLAQAEKLLTAVQTQVLLASVYLRDIVVDVDPLSEGYRADLQDSRDAIDQSLQQYKHLLDSAREREAFANLEREVEGFWAGVTQVLQGRGTLTPAESRRLRRQLVMPKREVILEIVKQIQALNRSAFEEQQAQVAQVYRDMHQRVWTRRGIALLVSLAAALLVTLYAGRLEAQVRQQARKDAQNKRDLQRLSARLVQAQEEERRTIARELHDEVGQALTAIKMEVAVAERARTAGNDVAGSLREIESITDQSLNVVRDLSQLLHPALLDNLGLPAALEWHLASFSRRTGVRSELLHEGMEERLAPEIETSAYRIVQEALTNVARHAQAQSCRVYVQRLPATLIVTIEDDGVGFDQQRGSDQGPHGLGLLGVQERVAGLNGAFRLESVPGKGTRLTVELPAAARVTAASPGGDNPQGPAGDEETV